MLRELHIENIAVIERAEISLGEGFTVLTGETGAGKSIIIDSINMVLGERVTRELVRSGAPAACVTALFSGIGEGTSRGLLEFGISPDEDGCVLISRELTADGKGTCRIGGRPVTAAVLREAGKLLVNIHGQHDNQALLLPEKHIGFLDEYARLSDELSQYREVYRQAGEVKRELSSLEMDEREKARRMELLRYQIDELSRAKLQSGEEEELTARRSLLKNASKLTEAVNEAYEALYSEDGFSAAEGISVASGSLKPVLGYSPELSRAADRLMEAESALEDAIEELRDFRDTLEYDPGEQDEIERRLDQLYRLKRKYGPTVEDMLTYLSETEEELSRIEFSDRRTLELQALQKALMGKLAVLADGLHRRREAAAKELEREIMEQLSFLDMSGVLFAVSLTDGEYDRNGRDRAEFLIATNRGEPPRPLVKIASGGELSRIMLALKAVLTGELDAGTLIFDEIDTGVSGRAAQKIGLKLRELAAKRQTLCVTHLPQIAALANRHLLIKKSSDDSRTFTTVEPLDGDGRVWEVARLLSGEDITDAALDNARDMLEKS